MNKKNICRKVNRREFIGQAALCTAVVAATAGAANAQDAPPKPADLLPTIQPGKYAVTRLISGYNPIGGYSHATSNLSMHMREYQEDRRGHRGHVPAVSGRSSPKCGIYPQVWTGAVLINIPILSGQLRRPSFQIPARPIAFLPLR